MPKKHLGQNFLYDPSILRNIINAAGLSEDDTVVEIGPGPGRLTRLLAEKVKKVIAIELDYKLYENLLNEFSGVDNVKLIHADALQFPFETIGRFKVVSNIPYYITTPIIFRLLDAKENLDTMTLTIQKEVAERIVANPGGKDYGVLSISIQFCAKPELIFIIPKEAFHPVPKVDSAVIHLKILDQPSVAVRDQQMFAKVVKKSFSHRRKTLSNSLKIFGGDIKEVLLSVGIDPVRRPETLSLKEFAKLSDAIKKVGIS